jgi:hypothetical protein
VDDPASRWLRRWAFYCPKLCARLSHAACVERQKRKSKVMRFGYGSNFRRNDDPLSRYCASGECKLGKRVKAVVRRRLVKLRVRGA